MGVAKFNQLAILALNVVPFLGRVTWRRSLFNPFRHLGRIIGHYLNRVKEMAGWKT
jgi:hypothetical protein